MKKPSDYNYYLIILVSLLINIDSIWSGSVDLAHHYALTYRIYEQWVLTSSSDLTLGEMNFYPRGSHILAAIIGTFLNSTFLGIQTVALLSFSFLWLFAILILKKLPDQSSKSSILMFTFILLINFLTFKYELHGNEIIGNFFYAQLVGHMILYGSILAAINIEKKYNFLYSAGLLAILMTLNLEVHLIPAIEMLGLIIIILLAHIYILKRNKKLKFSILSAGLLLIILSIAVVFFHPSFTTMREISSNNGAFEINNISYPSGLVLLALATITTSLILFNHWLKNFDKADFLPVKYLSIYGFIVAAICIIQYYLTFFGYGSDYAVKKYLYSITSIFLIQLSIILSRYLDTISLIYRNIIYKIPEALTSIIAISTLHYILISNQKILDVSDLVTNERALINLHDTKLFSPDEHKSNVIIGLNGFPNVINYLFSISIAKTPRALAISDILVKNNLQDLSNYSYILSHPDNMLYGENGCKNTGGISHSIINAQCLNERRVTETYCKDEFDFSVNGSIPNNMISSFSMPESHGRWTLGTVAKFECLIPAPMPRLVTFHLMPFIYGLAKSQRIEIIVNGNIILSDILTKSRSNENPIIIQLPSLPESKKYIFEFNVPDAISPRSVKLSDDSRVIGVSLNKIIFE